MTNMSALHPNTLNYPFKFEPFLRTEFNLGLDPDRPVCQYYNGHGGCPNGDNCPNKHVSSSFNNKIVCKHWLRGLCKKGDHCEFLHEYNLRKMPECLFFSKNGFCTQTPECQYLHIDPQSKIPECLNYSKGFCPEGPACKNRHIKKLVCQNYLTGFCPDGPDCDLAHPQFDPLPDKLRIRPDRPVDNKKKKTGKSVLELQIEKEREILRQREEEERRQQEEERGNQI